MRILKPAIYKSAIGPSMRSSERDDGMVSFVLFFFKVNNFKKYAFGTK